MEYLKNFGILFITLLLFFLGPTLVSYILLHFNPNMSLILITTISDAILIILFIIIFRKNLFKDFKDFKDNYKKYLKFGIKCWLIGVAVMFVSNILINYGIHNGDSISGNEQAARTLLLSSPILGMISAGLLAPFAEEIAFRFAFKKLFTGFISFVIVSTLIFGGIHLIADFNSLLDLLYLIPYCSIACSFAVAYYKTDNIFTTISLHMIHNILTYSLILFAYLGVGI